MSVALKVMRPGTGGRDTLRRFQQERQVLARLEAALTETLGGHFQQHHQIHGQRLMSL